ncbi:MULTISPECIES: Maf family nucleotide pyrophosphatase [Butyricimonas]|uniref:dTTP/UTP pyrophosphatase n=1 Tax=Butyricimonas paravirosa TaxID=1472417 RepID=A0A7X5YAN8_9BACT|nr:MULTISPECIES: Maf family nucleotide pyrophosphatase [Odoribacteraceae]NJC17331.1 septum formation protein [Butyricimonas paravirosa]RGG47839.1 septum formation protein Maf [Odoribacter sp. AF21-41]RHH98230.1 septum formation protein Maf [Odoribacter sp. AM16-33]WOF10898.1 septum formation protein Maf [Butyricimonas paravirosa]
MMHSIKNYKLILASASPRRQQLMKDAGFTFEVRLKNVEEKYPQELHLENVPEYLSKVKASAFREELKADEVLITADTVVCIHDRILGKPADRKEAISMLQKLSGNRHLVVTGVSVTTRTEQLSFSSRTDVFFKHLSNEEIEFYVDTYKPFDKAGAYGIQEWIGYIGIERIEGSFYNVMGLPIQKLYETLRKLQFQ